MPEKKKYLKNREDFSGNRLSKSKSITNRANIPEYGPLGDFYNYYAGLPLQHNKLRYSDYKPTNSRDVDAKYVTVDDPKFRGELIDHANRVFVDKNFKTGNEDYGDRHDYKINDNTYRVSGYGESNRANSIGRFYISKGTDDKGEYISYYDVFDSGTGKKHNALSDKLKATKPFEIYDRIYVNKNSEGKYIPKDLITTPTLDEVTNNGIPEYNLGGWIQDNKQGVLGGLSVLAGGALMATGIGGPLGASLIGSGVGNIAGEIQGDKQAELVKQQQMAASQGQPNQMATFANGGMIPQPNAELEDGEVFKTPDGNIGAIKQDTTLKHKNGGAPGYYPEGTQVLGNLKDKQTGMTFKEIGQKIAAKKAKLKELKEETKNKLTQNSIKAMESKLNNEFDQVYSRQERSKIKPRVKVPKTYEDGGTIDLSNNRVASNIDSTLGQFIGLPSYDQMIAETGVVDPINTALSDKSYNDALRYTKWNDFTDGNDFGFNTNTLSQLAPIGYNLYQGLQKPDIERLPEQYNQANALMANRRFNIDPMLESNRTGQAIADRNLVESGAGAGAIRAGRLGNYAARMRADQAAYSQQSNMNNQYLAQQAQGLYGTGAAQRQVDEANLANEAARRNFLASSAGQMSELAQRNELMKNMATRDQQTLDIYEKWMPMFKKQFGDLKLQ